MKILVILREVISVDTDDHHIVYNPESYAAAGGELLVLTMIISWILTYFFNYESIKDNPLKDRVGYNNLCVGWDTLPAKIVAGPMFALIIFVYSRFCQLDYWRAKLDTSMNTMQRNAVSIGIGLNCMSWFLSVGIFSISPQESPFGHTLSFVQLVVFGYIGYVCNIIEARPEHVKKGTIPFVIFFGIVCFAFGVCAMMQMWMYDPKTKQRGPVPWWLMFTFDYMYFACMGLQGFFRPAAPSIGAKYKQVSDDDYQVQLAKRDTSEEEEESAQDAEEATGLQS